MAGKDEFSTIDRVIDSINSEIEAYQASECINHRRKLCFKLVHMHNSKIYHALLDNNSHQWFRVPPSNPSYDFPQFIYMMRLLRQTLGEKFVLNQASKMRTRQGHDYFLFDVITPNMYTATRLSVTSLLNAFMGFVVFVCEVSHLCSGTLPDIAKMKFFYNHEHPILADMGKSNCDGARHVPSISASKKWAKLMRTAKSRFVLRYLTGILPMYFRKRKRKGSESPCIFKQEVIVSDATHAAICKSGNRTLYSVLEQHAKGGEVLFKHEASQLLSRIEEVESASIAPIRTLYTGNWT